MEPVSIYKICPKCGNSSLFVNCTEKVTSYYSNGTRIAFQKPKEYKEEWHCERCHYTWKGVENGENGERDGESKPE